MGFWGSVSPWKWFTPRVEYLGAPHLRNDTHMLFGGESLALSPAQMWKTQPHLRTVVSFLARNVAHLGLHVYERDEKDGRRRSRDSVAAKALARVDGVMTPHELIYALMVDRKLYDQAYWMVVPGDSASGWTIRRIPPAWISPKRQNAFEVETYQVALGNNVVEVPAAQILRFPGFHPVSPLSGSPALESLRDVMQEQIEAAAYRKQIWKRGGRVSAVLQRPVDAEPWTDAAREAFREDWYAKYTGNGSRAGGTPILEDGMTLNRIDFSAQEQQYVEAAKLSLQTIASAYHVEPSMLGLGSGATYSNMRAFRKMLYTETLGPDLDYIESRLNTFLLPMLGVDPARFYVEFNIAEKLQGDFEEQAAVLSTSTGRPWMTANEARARQNLPAIPGGDELIVPLNVLIGGQASPADSGSQNEVPDPVEEDRPKALVWRKPKGAPGKARPSAPEIDKHAEVLKAFFARQRKAVLSRLGAKADGWWDQERWDNELASDLTKLSLMTATAAGRRALADAGLSEDDYSEPRTVKFLTEASRRNAARINETTKAQLDNTLDSDEPDAEHVFDVAEESRAGQVATTAATFAAGFGVVEAARQNSDKATKTWVVTSSNPRPEHAAMNGETVPVEDDFSNGLPWPGAAGADVDQVANCSCEMVINL